MAPKKNENEITIIGARLSFPKLFEAESVNDGAPRYSCTFLLDPKVPAHRDQITAIRKRVAALAKSELKIDKMQPDKICIKKDGPWDGYAGMWYVSCARREQDGRPQVVDANPDNPLTADDGKPYAGCYVNGVIRLWVQKNSWGKRINAGLEVVQFTKDGEPFGAPRASTSSLPNVEEDAEDEDGFEDEVEEGEDYDDLD